MIKVQILIPCKKCEGEAYVPVGETVSYTGERYMRYIPCTACGGSGSQEKWISLREVAVMLETELAKYPMEPDYLELAQEQPTSQYQDSRDAAGI